MRVSGMAEGETVVSWTREQVTQLIQQRNDKAAWQRQVNMAIQKKEIETPALVEILAGGASETESIPSLEKELKHHREQIHDLAGLVKLDGSKLAKEWEAHVINSNKFTKAFGGSDSSLVTAKQQLTESVAELKNEIQHLKLRLTFYPCPSCKRMLKWDASHKQLQCASNGGDFEEDDDDDDSEEDIQQSIDEYSQQLTQFTDALGRCEKEMATRTRLLQHLGILDSSSSSQTSTNPWILDDTLVQQVNDCLTRIQEARQKHAIHEKAAHELQRVLQLLRQHHDLVLLHSSSSSLHSLSSSLLDLSDPILQKWASLPAQAWANKKTSLELQQELATTRDMIAATEKEMAAFAHAEKEYKNLQAQADRYETILREIQSKEVAIIHARAAVEALPTVEETDVQLNFVHRKLSYLSDLERAMSVLDKLREKETQLVELQKERDHYVELVKRIDFMRQKLDDSETALLAGCVKHVNDVMKTIFPYLFDQDIQTDLLLSKTAKTTQRVSHRVDFQIRFRSDKERSLETLSGGESERVNMVLTLALASMTTFPFLFVDEAFGSLDIETRDRCIGALRHAAQTIGKCIVLVCHDSLEGLFDNVIYVHPQIQ
jgi:DNA repair exonuclease SbcCD ATPase subunit